MCVVMSSAGFIVRVTIVLPDLIGVFIAISSALSGAWSATPESDHFRDAGGRDGSPRAGGPFVSVLHTWNHHRGHAALVSSRLASCNHSSPTQLRWRFACNNDRHAGQQDYCRVTKPNDIPANLPLP